LTFEAILYIESDVAQISVDISSNNIDVIITTAGTGANPIKVLTTASTTYQLPLGRPI
jgi:molybdopterin biosynthesis enzyme MoaB